MEVHPHHVTHKKNWKEYILEFFMLFFAVFLGFIVENIREHYVEHQRAKEYAQSLYDDLKEDSVFLNRITSLKLWRGVKLDSLILLVKQPNLQENARELYYYNCFIETDLPFRPSDITIQQLRNSGSLRYFTNLQLYNSITQYYNNCNFYFERENDAKQMMPPISLTAKIFNMEQYMSLIEDPPPLDISRAIHRPSNDKEYKLVTTDAPTWNEYALYVLRQKIRNGLSILLLGEIVGKPQTELMAALRKEYRVK